MRQQERKRIRNRAHKAELKTTTRRLTDALHDGKVEVAKETFQRLTKRLDQAAARGTLHRNTVARRKSRLARKLNAAKAGKSSS